MTVKPSNLSKNVTDIMSALSKNEGLARLLIHDIGNPLDTKEYSTRPSFDKEGYYVLNQNGKYALPVIDKSKLINQNSELCRIHPFPFDPDAQIEDSSFIRVYYNSGDFDGSQTINELTLFVDVIVAKSLWLIKNTNGEPAIRPYEIMDRVIDLVGKKSVGTKTKVNFEGFQHLAVNSKFDAIRLYSEYFNVNTNIHSYDGE